MPCRRVAGLKFEVGIDRICWHKKRPPKGPIYLNAAVWTKPDKRVCAATKDVTGRIGLSSFAHGRLSELCRGGVVSRAPESPGSKQRKGRVRRHLVGLVLAEDVEDEYLRVGVAFDDRVELVFGDRHVGDPERLVDRYLEKHCLTPMNLKGSRIMRA